MCVFVHACMCMSELVDGESMEILCAYACVFRLCAYMYTTSSVFISSTRDYSTAPHITRFCELNDYQPVKNLKIILTH